MMKNESFLYESWITPLSFKENSVLVGFGEVSTFAGALFGVDYTYKYKYGKKSVWQHRETVRLSTEYPAEGRKTIVRNVRKTIRPVSRLEMGRMANDRFDRSIVCPFYQADTITPPSGWIDNCISPFALTVVSDIRGLRFLSSS